MKDSHSPTPPSRSPSTGVLNLESSSTKEQANREKQTKVEQAERGLSEKVKTKNIRNPDPARKTRQSIFYRQSTTNARVLDVDIHVTIEMTLYVRCHDAHSGRRSGDSLEDNSS